MTKTYKAVLRSSLVMLSLLALAVVSSGVAQAQECFARRASGGPNTVRAEGMTELLPGIELLCNGGGGTGFSAPTIIEISIELNTSITNRTDDETDAVMGLTYTDTDDNDLNNAGDPDPDLGAAGDYSGTTNNKNEVLSDDGMAISWEIPSMELGISNRNDDGGTVVIRGLMADASAVGNGEDITVTVMVSGLEATGSPVKLADVTTGLDIKVTAATGLQCDTSTKKATIMFTEGFNSAITAVYDPIPDDIIFESARNSVLVLNFRGIPDGVTVMASLMGTGEALKDDGSDLAPLMLVTGEDEGADEDGMVTLSSVGAGEVMYRFSTGLLVGDEDSRMPDDDISDIDDGTKEWNNVEITFKWKAGEPPLDMGTVTVSYEPVSSDTDDIPRFISGPTNDVIKIGDCTTTLLFPFVTNKHGFNTGLVITNASEGSGSCTIEYSGSDAPDDMTSQPVAGGAQWITLVSSVAPDFQGYVTTSCEFRDAHGFAFITGGGTTPSMAQGYLAVCTSGCD